MKKLLLAALFAYSCLPATASTNTTQSSAIADQKKTLQETQKALYDQSIAIAKVQHNPKPAHLVAITPWNDTLIWKDENKTELLMVSWMSEWAMNTFYKPSLGKKMTTNSNPKYLSWVTSEPEIRNFAKSYTPTTELTLQDRLNQRLGLPPTQDPKYFVQMWVKAVDLFRPCLDSEVIDDTCIVDLEKEDLPAGFQDITKFICINPEHKKWFEERRATSYEKNSPGAFPWSRLGYTYDWGNPTDHVGFSEFAIKPSSTIEIINIIPTDDYAQSPLPAHHRKSSDLNQKEAKESTATTH